MINALEHIMPAYAIHSDCGEYLGTIIPQDSNCRVYTRASHPETKHVPYGILDQGVVIARLVEDILRGDL